MPQIHRFRDRVAVSLRGMRETVYLTPSDALDLAEKLARVAADCRQVAFTDSTVGTFDAPEGALSSEVWTEES